MTARLVALCFDAADPPMLARFWAAALRWEVGAESAGSVGLVPTDGTGFRIVFLPVPEGSGPKVGKNRIHLDLTTASPADQAETVETLRALGAAHADVGQGPDAPHVVLADPEGNELCVIEPGNSFLAGCGRLGSITCDGSRQAGYFWSAALGWPLVWDQDDETAVRSPGGAGPFITWGPPVEPRLARSRVHLELAAAAAAGGDEEVERLVSLGATLVEGVRGRDHAGGVAMADPDGNEFWLLPPR